MRVFSHEQVSHTWPHPLPPQATPPVSFTDAEKRAMTDKIANAGTVVVEAKAGKVCVCV